MSAASTNTTARATSRTGVLRLALLVAVFAALLVGAVSANAATYYVAKTGSDSAGGTSTGTALLTIKAAISKAATTGDTISVGAGTYSESNLAIGKSVTIVGAGQGSDAASNTIISAASASYAAVSITLGSVTLQSLRITGATGTGIAGAGLLVNNTAAITGLTFQQITVTGNSGDGIAFNNSGTLADVTIDRATISSNGANGISVASNKPSLTGFTVKDSTIRENVASGFSSNPSATASRVLAVSFLRTNFVDNVSGGAANVNDISFTGFSGVSSSASFTNVTVSNAADKGSAHAAHGVMFSGKAAAAPTIMVAGETPAGNGLSVSGTFGKSALFFTSYTSLASVNLANLDVSSAVVGANWAQVALEHTSSDSASRLVLGNTTLKTLGLGKAGGVDATGATFKDATTGTTLDRSVFADNLTIEAQVYHCVDAASLGFVTWVSGSAYVTGATASVNRAIAGVAAGSTIYVVAGTYNENLTISKSVTLLGPNEGVTVFSGAPRAPEAVIGNTGNAASRVSVSGASTSAVIAGFKFVGASDPNGNGSKGIYVSGGGSGEIRNNWFSSLANPSATRLGSADVYVLNSNAGLSGGTYAITGNRFDGPTTDAPSTGDPIVGPADYSAINAWYLNDVTISGNRIQNYPFAGIQLESTRKGTVTGNTVENVGATGIQIANGVNVGPVLVQGNTIDHASALYESSYADVGAPIDTEYCWAGIRIWQSSTSTAEVTEVLNNKITNIPARCGAIGLTGTATQTVVRIKDNSIAQTNTEGLLWFNYTVWKTKITNGVAAVTLWSDSPGISAGDTVVVSDLGAPFDGTHTVTATETLSLPDPADPTNPAANLSYARILFAVSASNQAEADVVSGALVPSARAQFPIPASRNWWGDAAGPGAAGSSRNSAGAGAGISPWIADFDEDPDKSGDPGFWPINVVTAPPIPVTGGDGDEPASVVINDPTIGAPALSLDLAPGDTANVSAVPIANPETGKSPFRTGASTILDISAEPVGDAVVAGPFTICVNGIPGTTRLWHFEDVEGALKWVDITDRILDPTKWTPASGGRVCGMTATLSPFAIADPVVLVTATSSNATITYGDVVTLKASLPVDATGSIVFTEGTTELGTCTLVIGATESACTVDVPHVTPTSVARFDAGDHTVTAAYDGDENYLAQSKSRTFTVAKKALTLTANPRSKTYGTVLTLGTTEFTPSGLVGTDAVSSVTLASTGADASAAAGSFDITGSGAAFSPGTADNYDITYPTGTLTVDKATLTGVLTASDRTYDGSASALASCSVSADEDLVSPDDVSCGVDSASFDSAAAGTNKTVTASVSLGGDDEANYELASSSITDTADIDKAVLTGVLTASDKTYDGSASALASCSVSADEDLVSPDDVSCGVDSASFDSAAAGTNKTVTASVSLGGDDEANYELASSSITDTADIDKAVLTGVLTASDKTYDGSASALASCSVSADEDLVSPDDVSCGVDSASFDSAAAGTNKTVTASVSLGGDDEANYELASSSITDTADIDKAVLTGVLTASDKTYDGSASALASCSVSADEDLVSPDDVSCGVDSASFDSAAAGTNKTVTASVSLGGDDEANYELASSSITDTADIDKAVLTGVLTASDKTYDGSASALASCSVSADEDLVSPDDVSCGVDSASFDSAAAGTNKTVTASVSLGGDDEANYELASSSITDTADIDKAVLTGVLTASDKTYDGSASALASCSVSADEDLVSPDDVSCGVDSASFDSAAAGTNKTVTASVSLGGDDEANYELASSSITDTADIDKAVLTGVLTASDKTYDGSASALASCSVSADEDLVSPDDVSCGVDSASFDSAAAGTNKTVTASVSLGGDDEANYELASSSITDTADIDKAVLTGVLTASDKTYDGSASALASCSVSADEDLVSPDDVSCGVDSASFDSAAAGTNKTVTASVSLGGDDEANYELASSSITDTADITRATLTITASNRSKTYGDSLTLGTSAFTTSGLQSTDTVTAVTLTSAGSVASAAVTTYPIVPSAAVFGVGSASNYDIKYTNGTLTVNAATGITILYVGDTYVGAGGTSATLKAQLSGTTLCLNAKTITFYNDSDGNGTYETTLGTGTTNSAGLATLTLSLMPGIYEVKTVFPGDANCTGADAGGSAVNTATLVIASAADSSNGGGWYSISGRANFGYTAQVKTTKTGTTVTGQILWHVNGKTRIKGVVTAYIASCPNGTMPPTGTTCGYVTGTGTIFQWNSLTSSWAQTATNVSYRVTVADGGTATVCAKRTSCTTTLNADYFRMDVPSLTLDGESTALTQLKGGNIVVAGAPATVKSFGESTPEPTAAQPSAGAVQAIATPITVVSLGILSTPTPTTLQAKPSKKRETCTKIVRGKRITTNRGCKRPTVSSTTRRAP